MCGIFGYTGNKEALPILVDGLRLLEYRGYDSAGVYTSAGASAKCVGGVDALRTVISSKLKGEAGIGHLRWATHGEPSERNAHPHVDCKGVVWAVHNGIIENFKSLKDGLSSHAFVSDTDTEVLVHLIEEAYQAQVSLEAAVMKALKKVEGTYGLAVMSAREPGKIVIARMGAPIVLGLGDGENFVASDPSPIMRHTKSVVYLEDGEVAILTPTSHTIMTLGNRRVARPAEEIEWEIEDMQKGEYPHFMLKEIMEGPEVVRNTMRGRLIIDDGLAKLGGLELVEKKLRHIDRLVIVACGTAYYAGLVGEYMLEEYAGIPVEVEIASEFRYRKPVLGKHTAVLAISQSGETADTLEAVREARRKGILTIGIVNVVGSTIARETDAGIYNHAGPEVGVASTKAFISQLIALSLLTLFLGRQRHMSLVTGRRVARELWLLPDKIGRVLSAASTIEQYARLYSDYDDFLYIGRKYNAPIAYEGALKLKEISYIHAEGYAAGEMKHGPLAMIDETFPTVAIAPQDSVYEKMISNIQEIRARKGPVLAVSTEGDENIRDSASHVIFIPKTLEMLTPILSAVPLQLLAYYMATIRGHAVDRPRNLAKSVTVE